MALRFAVSTTTLASTSRSDATGLCFCFSFTSLISLFVLSLFIWQLTHCYDADDYDLHCCLLVLFLSFCFVCLLLSLRIACVRVRVCDVFVGMRRIKERVLGHLKRLSQQH